MIDSTNTCPINEIMKDLIYSIFCKPKKEHFFFLLDSWASGKIQLSEKFQDSKFECINFYFFAKARE